MELILQCRNCSILLGCLQFKRFFDDVSWLHL